MLGRDGLVPDVDVWGPRLHEVWEAGRDGLVPGVKVWGPGLDEVWEEGRDGLVPDGFGVQGSMRFGKREETDSYLA